MRESLGGRNQDSGAPVLLQREAAQPRKRSVPPADIGRRCGSILSRERIALGKQNDLRAWRSDGQSSRDRIRFRLALCREDEVPISNDFGKRGCAFGVAQTTGGGLDRFSGHACSRQKDVADIGTRRYRRKTPFDARTLTGDEREGSRIINQQSDKPATA